MSKISLLYNILNFNLVQFGIFYGLVSVDGSMVPYFGCHSAKMFISPIWPGGGGGGRFDPQQIKTLVT